MTQLHSTVHSGNMRELVTAELVHYAPMPNSKPSAGRFHSEPPASAPSLRPKSPYYIFDSAPRWNRPLKYGPAVASLLTTPVQQQSANLAVLAPPPPRVVLTKEREWELGPEILTAVPAAGVSLYNLSYISRPGPPWQYGKRSCWRTTRHLQKYVDVNHPNLLDWKDFTSSHPPHIHANEFLPDSNSVFAELPGKWLDWAVYELRFLWPVVLPFCQYCVRCPTQERVVY